MVAFTSDAAESLRKETLILVSGDKRHKISIEVAETPQQKAMGLMFRTSLGRRTGMLFPHSEPQELTMWMRNTYIPLDMVFIRTDGTVHRIEENTEPFSEAIIASRGKVVAVLELAGGVAREVGLKAGDRVEGRWFKPAPK
ncbi:MAG: DUF192 domain-containing protein [Hyphomicrobiaceae bacterium]